MASMMDERSTEVPRVVRKADEASDYAKGSETTILEG